MASANRVAVVTGGARGIGLAVTDDLLKSAYRVCLVDNHSERGKEAESNLKGKYGSDKVIFVECDVSSKEEFTVAFEKAISFFGRIDLVINSAGIASEKLAARTVAVNLTGSINGCQLAVKFMGKQSSKKNKFKGKGGVVINVSSIAGFLPYSDTPAYVSTKHALIGLTRSYGHKIHFDKEAVLFMAVCPHYTDTPILKETDRLNYFTPDEKDLVLMPVDKTVQGVMKLLTDKINGSTLLVLPDRDEYVEIPENLSKIPTALPSS